MKTTVCIIFAILVSNLYLSLAHSSTLVRIAISSSPSKLSPFFSTDANSQNINRLVHKSLIDFDRDLNPICVLCESFYEKMEGQKHVIGFNLLKDQKFSDGESLDAHSVKYAWQLFAKDMNIKSIFRFAFGNIEDVRVISDHKVELVYKKYGWDNLPNLVLFKILKIKDVAKGQMTQKPVEVSDIIGAGEYKYEKIEKLEVIIAPTFDPSRPKLVFKVVRDETTLSLKIINNEIDLSIAQISPRKYFFLKKQNSLKFFEAEGSAYKYIGINHKNEFLKHKNIRKAVSHLIPRKDLKKYKMRDLVTLSNSLFSKAFTKLSTEREVDSFDQKKAKALIEELGFKKNDNGLYEKDGKVLEINWRISNNKATVELVNTIKDYFNKNGIKSSVTVQEWGTFFRGIKKGQFDLFVGQWVGFTGPDMLKMIFHSDSIPPGGANRGFYVNPEFDKVLDSALAKTSLDQAKDEFKKAMDIATDDYSYIHLWHPKVAWIGQKCIKELNPFSNGSFLGFLDMKVSCE